MIQIDQIKAFVRCTELGSLSAAARAERAPKSTLSRLLHELENALGAPLFNRSTRGMTLTQDGRVFLAHARQILDDIDVAEAAIRSSPGMPAGVVRLTAPYTFGVTFISPLLPAFFSAYPQIDVQIELTSRNVDLAAEGYDLAIRIGSPPPDWVARRIMANPLSLCASPDYLWKFGRPAHPDELGVHRLLLIGTPRTRSSLKLWKAGSPHMVSANPRLLSSDPAVILRSTRDGVGIGQIPLILAGDQIAHGDLVRVLEDWKMPEVDICILHLPGRLAVPRVRALADFIADSLASDREPSPQADIGSI